MLGSISALALLGRLPVGMAGLYLVSSAVAFALYWHDKHAARQGRRRVPESTLLLWGLAGGWPGALAAQQLFRHKTAKRPFQWAFWSSVLVNIAVFGWGMTRLGGVLS